MTELKPCPFCGGIMVSCSLMPYIGYDGHGYVVECDRCWAKTGYYRTKEEAAEAWNARHVETCHVVNVDVDPDGVFKRKIAEENGVSPGRVSVVRPTCSECGEGLMHGKGIAKFCPNCGAKVVER